MNIEIISWEMGYNMFGVFHPKNNLYKPLTREQLNIRLPRCIIKPAYHLSIRGVLVGQRFNHGNGGKRGISFPDAATRWHDEYLDAESAMLQLKTYFADLYANSFWGPKAKRAGVMKDNWFLVDK